MPPAPRKRPAAWRHALLAWALGGAAAPAFGHVNPWPEPARPAASHPPIIRVGSLKLHACGPRGAYCGDLPRPLDPAGHIAGSLTVHFEFYPHRAAGEPTTTLVATEGGPGYPATLSRDDYLDLFGPLMNERDVLLMDNRGTGQSGAIDCHALQTGATWTVEAVGECGASLGDAAALYGTAYAADDLAALLQALEISRIDLYGDSYGTYFEQAFAVRHPGLLRSVVLDGAYPLDAPDYAWYPNYAPAMRDKFNLGCRRFAPCAALPGTSLDHVAPALAALRAAPFAASAKDADGTLRRFTADAAHLAIVMFGAAPAATTTREVDAAARAFADGDRLPLLRLMAETAAAVDSRDPTANPRQWSAGLAAAVMCHDPPQIYDMRLPPAQRAESLARVLAERRRSAPDTYSPFTIDEYRGMPLDYNFLDQCVSWPVAPSAHPASQWAAGAAYPDVPALVLSGEFDDITSVADGAAVAAAFPRGQQVVLANSFHVNALPRARSACGATLARRFLATHELGDVTCAAAVPPLELVGRFATTSGELAPLSAAPHNAASAVQLRRANAALLAVDDILARADLNSSGRGVGLRGGEFRVRRGPAGLNVTFHDVRFTEDVAVSGWLTRTPGRQGRVRAAVDVPDGHLDVTRRLGGGAVLRGRMAGHIVAATAR